MSAALGIISPAATTLEDLTTTSNTALAEIAVDVAATAVRGDVSGTVYDPVSGANLTIKRALKAVPTNTTDSSIIAAVTDKKLRILAIKGFNGATASTITFNTKGSGAGTAISAPFVLPVSIPLDFHPSNMGWLETAAGEAFTATTAASGATVALQVLYVEVPA